MEEIAKLLIEKGFTRNENEFTKKQKVVTGQVVENGNAQKLYQEIEITFTYIGDASIENLDGTNHEDATQWQLCVNKESQGDFIIRDAAEFERTFKL